MHQLRMLKEPLSLAIAHFIYNRYNGMNATFVIRSGLVQRHLVREEVLEELLKAVVEICYLCTFL